MNKLKRALEFIDKVLLSLSSLLLAIIVLLAILQVFYRYVLNASLGWSEELTRIGFIWMTFIASAVVIHRRRHLKIDVFVMLLPKRKQEILDIIVNIFILFFMVFLSIQAFELAERAARTVTGAMRLPRSVFFLPVAYGAFFSCLFGIRLIIESIIIFRNDSKKLAKENS